MKNARLSPAPFRLFDLAALVGPICGSDGENEGEADAGRTGATENNGDPAKKIAALTEEKDRHYAKRQDAEKTAADLKRERDELAKWKEEQENAKKGDVERLQGQIDKLTKANSDLQTTNDRLAVENAFHAANDVQWHNPKRALSSLDLSDVKIEGGKVDVEALKKKIEALAKDEPYLVKTKEGEGSNSDSGDGSKGKNEGKATGKTGTPPGKKDVGAGKGNDLEALAKKYPALRGRLGRSS